MIATSTKDKVTERVTKLELSGESAADELFLTQLMDAFLKHGKQMVLIVETPSAGDRTKVVSWRSDGS